MSNLWRGRGDFVDELVWCLFRSDYMFLVFVYRLKWVAQARFLGGISLFIYTMQCVPADYMCIYTHTVYLRASRECAHRSRQLKHAHSGTHMRGPLHARTKINPTSISQTILMHTQAICTPATMSKNTHTRRCRLCRCRRRRGCVGDVCESDSGVQYGVHVRDCVRSRVCL